MDTAIPLSDDQGRALLDGCRCTRQFLSLAQQFQYQENLAYCGVATGCVVLNSLGCPAPASDTHGEFRYFTQSNLLGPGTEPVKPQSEIRMSGMALSEFTQIVMSHGPSALAIYGSDLDEDQLHATLSEHTSGNKARVVLNYPRQAVGQVGGGHISPIGAYNQDSRAALIMDVAPYKYPFIWVGLRMLLDAIRAPTVEGGPTRGLCLVRV